MAEPEKSIPEIYGKFFNEIAYIGLDFGPTSCFVPQARDLLCVAMARCERKNETDDRAVGDLIKAAMVLLDLEMRMRESTAGKIGNPENSWRF